MTDPVVGPNDELARRITMTFALQQLRAGKVCIIGSQASMEIGRPLGKLDSVFLVVKRRATREDFLKYAPGSLTEPPPAVPFYWELEIG